MTTYTIRLGGRYFLQKWLSSSTGVLVASTRTERNITRYRCGNLYQSGNIFGNLYEGRRISPSHGLNLVRRCMSIYSSEQIHHGYHVPHVKITPCNDTDSLKIEWLKEDKSKDNINVYPYIWLRDVCRCKSCFHAGVQARIADFSEIDPEVHPIHVEIRRIELEGERVGDANISIKWSDGHESEYSVNWLRRFKFDKSEKDYTLDPNVRHWGADVGETQLKCFEFDDLLHDDRALHGWLIELQELGLTVVKNTPRETRQLHRIGDRVAFLRPCNYGPTFQVKSKIDASNAAYTSGRLPLHTDLAYYIWAPGIQLLHCIDQVTGTGGENILSDGFKAAEELQQQNPEAYRILTSTVLEYYDIGTDYYGNYHQSSRHPVIRLDDGGNVAAIYWSDHGRSPMLRVPQEDVKPLYRAMKAYHNILYRPENLFKYKMDNGDILCFNNRRTLHGREAFTATETSNRHLEGGYLEWDEVNSRIRVLKDKLDGDILCFNNRRTIHGREAFTATETSNRHLEGGYLEWDEVNSRIRVLKDKLDGMNDG